MPSCPFCQTELTDDFGLVDCPGCEASLFIEMDGSVRSNDSESATPEPAAPEPAAPEPLPMEMAPAEDLEFAEPEMQEPEPEPEPEPVSFSEALQDPPLEVPQSVSDHLDSADISNLATAIDQRGAVDGLRYDLRISGIDTADLRREVFEAFVDKKLGWDAEEIINNIDAGVLELKSVAAVKAQVIVQRLKVLPLQIRWDQYADS